jgi:hypothetical protein
MTDDVGRLQIAMDDAEIVRELEGEAERRNDRLDVRQCEPSARGDFVPDGKPVQELHHQKGMVFVVDVEVEDRHDVRMPEPGAGAALAEKALAHAAVRMIAADHLDRDLVAEERAFGTIHGPHAPFGKETENLVAIIEDLSGTEHQCH